MSPTKQAHSKIHPPSLATLSGVPLSTEHESLLAQAAGHNTGPPAFQHRKVAEAKDLLRLAQLSGRFRILDLDLTTNLRADLLMRVTVPCLPDPHGKIHIAPWARLGVTYREEAMRLPQPGYSFVQILDPHPVWHPHVSHDQFQVMCLGSHISPSFPLRELILLTYMALTMVAIRLDTDDPAGLLNYESCVWWTRNISQLPLSQEPFIREKNSLL